MIADGSGSEGRQDGPEARAQRALTPAAALPCLYGNNSIQTGQVPPPKGYRLKRQKNLLKVGGQVVADAGSDIVKDAGGRMIDEREGGVLINSFAEFTGPERRLAFQLRQNVAAFVEHWGRNHCAFWTITDQENVHPREFAKRWNSFLSNTGKWVRAFCRVLELQRNGRPHYHILTATPWDMEPAAFNWTAFDGAQREFRANGRTPEFYRLTKEYKASAPLAVRAIWKRLRDALPRYGLGRSEFLPMRKGAEALSEYVGKYLEAGLLIRRHDCKGIRRVETDRRTSILWKKCSRVFGWASAGAKTYRSRLAELAGLLGIADMEGFREQFGVKWAYHLRGSLLTDDDEAFVAVCATLRAQHELDVERRKQESKGVMLIGHPIPA